MSKENPLNHHEQLRYDYLFKNIYYLNEREKREFDYLQTKINRASSDTVGEKKEVLEPLVPPYPNASLLYIVIVAGLRNILKKIQSQKLKNRKENYAWVVSFLASLLFYHV